MTKNRPRYSLRIAPVKRRPRPPLLRRPLLLFSSLTIVAGIASGYYFTRRRFAAPWSALAAQAEARGRVYAAQGRYPEAIRAYRESIGLNPSNYTAYIELALAQQMSGDYRAAVSAYAQAKKAAPEDLHVYIAEGYARLSHSDFPGARQDFTAAVALSSSSAEASHHLGTFYAVARNPSKALRYFAEALRLLRAQPRNENAAFQTAHVLLRTGMAYSDIGEKQKAAAALRRCLKLLPANDPVGASCLLGLADIDAPRGCRRETSDLFRAGQSACRVSGERPRDICSMILARYSLFALTRCGRREDAQRLYRSAYALRPSGLKGTDPDLYCRDLASLGRASLALGLDQQAEENYSRLLAVQKVASKDPEFRPLASEASRALAALRKKCSARRDPANSALPGQCRPPRLTARPAPASVRSASR